MARMALTFGACPVCGDHVPRTLQMAAGLQKEIFHCEQHGRMPYSSQHVPLAELAAGLVPVDLGAQPMTGLEMVC